VAVEEIQRRNRPSNDIQSVEHKGVVMQISQSPKHRIAVFAAITVLALMLSNCASQASPSTYDPPGFFSGLLHGSLIFFSFIASLFTDVRIYSFPNSGGWYGFGYLIGAGLFASASSY
jgi:hypothetical protein